MTFPSDPKRGEREYFARIGEAGRRHAAGKPFNDERCVEYLANVSALMSVMAPPPGRIVEFGCGSGWLGRLFAERGYDVEGIDISPEAVEMAQRAAAERGLGIVYRVADYESVCFAQPADYVVFHDALHHAESELAALKAAYQALRPGGMVLCIEPGQGHSQSAASRHAVEAYGVHEKDMPPSLIWQHAKAAGFSRHVVLPWPWFHLRAVYRPAYAQAVSARELTGRKWLSFWRTVKAFFTTRSQGLVVLWRD